MIGRKGRGRGATEDAESTAQAATLRTGLPHAPLVGSPPSRLPAGSTLAPGERLIVAGAEPDAFCQRNPLPADIGITGPLARPLIEQDLNLTRLQPVPWGAGDRAHYRTGGGSTGMLRSKLMGFGNEPASWQAAALQPGDGAGSAPADLQVCSFDVFVNAGRQVEVRWATSPVSAADALRLLRSPIDDLGRVEIVMGDTSATGEPSATPGLFSHVDPTANPDEEYLYRLDVVDSAGAACEIAITTVRTAFFASDAPLVYR